MGARSIGLNCPGVITLASARSALGHIHCGRHRRVLHPALVAVADGSTLKFRWGPPAWASATPILGPNFIDILKPSKIRRPKLPPRSARSGSASRIGADVTACSPASLCTGPGKAWAGCRLLSPKWHPRTRSHTRQDARRSPQYRQGPAAELTGCKVKQRLISGFL